MQFSPKDLSCYYISVLFNLRKKKTKYFGRLINCYSCHPLRHYIESIEIHSSNFFKLLHYIKKDLKKTNYVNILKKLPRRKQPAIYG